MSVILGATGITFGDGTVQITNTPTVVSAFTNDGVYITDSAISPTYTPLTGALYNWAWSGYYLGINTYNVTGGLISSQAFNCNCNC